MIALLDRTRGADYNCADYTAEVWEAETGYNIRPLLRGFLSGNKPQPELSFAARLHRIPEPRDPCIVLLRRGTACTHAGVYRKGRVQHLGTLAPIRQPLHIATLGYTEVRFYAPR